MKICAVGLRGIPNIMGGIESHCQQLYPRMQNDQVSIVVLARSPYVDGKSCRYKGVEVRSVWTVKHKFIETFLHTFIAIIYARIVIKPDILHLHAIGPALLTPLAKLLGMQVLVTHHGADYDRQKWNAGAKKLLRLGETMAVKWADSVIVVGKSLTRRLKAEFPKHAEKISYVPNGALAPTQNEVTQIELANCELPITAGKYILAVGRLVPEKGFHDLIDAFKKTSTDQDLKLVIVGAADHQDDYSANLLKQEDQRVIFAGRRTGNQLSALYKYCQRFVLPSYHEGLPIVALEALSFGVPVLLSDIQPNLDIGLPEACYFSVGDTLELADALQHLPSSSQPNKDVILKQFDWNQIAQQTRLVVS